MKNFKKIAVRLIACAMILTLCIGVIPTTEAKAANVYKINGKSIRYTDFSSSPNQCWVYANKVYNKIWGQQFTSTFGTDDNSLRNLKDSELTLTKEHLKEYVSNAPLGAVLRICNSQYLHANDGWGHSMIIVQKDEDGFTVIQGGLPSSPYCNEKYYTWSSFCNTGWLGGTYAYIKYVKWPGAPAYSPNALKQSEVTLNKHKVSAGRTAKITWTEVDGAEKYVLKCYYRGDKILQQNVTGLDSYRVNYTAAGQYKFSIVAKNEKRKSTSSQVTLTVKPQSAVISSVTSNKSGRITLKWNEVAGATGYQVQVARNANFTKGVKSATATSEKKTMQNLKSRKKYYVRVRASINNGKIYGPWSEVMTIKCK